MTCLVHELLGNSSFLVQVLHVVLYRHCDVAACKNSHARMGALDAAAKTVASGMCTGIRENPTALGLWIDWQGK
jgi:hypothetical protein